MNEIRNVRGKLATNTKEIYKRILWTVMYRQIGQAIRNRHVSGNIKPAKTESGSTSCERKSVIEKIAEINCAYDILSNEDKRKKYDESLNNNTEYQDIEEQDIENSKAYLKYENYPEFIDREQAFKKATFTAGITLILSLIASEICSPSS